MNIRIKNNKGITLIALVITIIVLLILAGVAIASLTGENGILIKAQTSRDNTEEETVEEKVKLAVQSAYTEGKGIIERDNLDNELKDLFGTGKYEISDGDAPWTVTVEDYEATVNSKGKVAKEEEKDKDSLETKPGKPDLEGYFTESSTINGGKVSATNPKIPAGFMPVDEGDAIWGDGTSAPTEEAVNEGLVIQDKNDNQFVWVPVSVFTDFERELGYVYGSKQSYQTFTTEGLTSDKYYEPEGDGETVDTNASEDIQEVQKMYKSVNKNKGFYIGRYETGFEGDTVKGTYNSYSAYTPENVKTETEKLLVQADKQVYNYVPWGAGVEDISAVNTGTADSPAYVIGAVELARNFDTINGYTNVTSTLCYGVQWDAVMRWMKEEPNPNVSGKTYIQDSTGMGWYSNNYSSGNSNHKTGIDVDINASNKVKNIYDLAGNVFEWTMEAYSTDDIGYRGASYGSAGSDFPASHRTHYHTTRTNAHLGFRLALFM